MTAGTNDALFIDVLAQIEAHPKTWQQLWWSENTDCGTAYCMAGWACVLGGLKFKSYDTVTGDLWAPIAATDLLGVVGRNVIGNGNLFDANNTLDDLYRISADLMGIAEQVLRDKVQDRLAS